MKCDTGDVPCMALKRENGGRICRPDVVEFDGVMPSSGQEAFVWRNAEAIHLRVRVWDRS
jgi:hypothetical protein